jgi:hypothetical protein
MSWEDIIKIKGYSIDITSPEHKKPKNEFERILLRQYRNNKYYNEMTSLYETNPEKAINLVISRLSKITYPHHGSVSVDEAKSAIKELEELRG